MHNMPKTFRPAGTPDRKAQLEQHDRKRPSARERGYDRTWEKVRKMHLNEEPLCRECMKSGRATPGEHVDHIIPLAQGGARLSDANLQTLCALHHNQKTGRERRS